MKTFKSITVIRGNNEDAMANAVVNAVKNGRHPMFVNVAEKIRSHVAQKAMGILGTETITTGWVHRDMTDEDIKTKYGEAEIEFIDCTEEWDGTLLDFEGNKHKLICGESRLELSDDSWLVSKINGNKITLRRAETDDNGMMYNPIRWSKTTVTKTVQSDGNIYGRVWGEKVAFKWYK